ncbi:MAG: PEP-CTERM sorting domain-containing protein [Verrucomicrobiota bacterium JB022]|nr:PEP-CTERM sorting domain-containing protein [Verrucomicrobiota bacterium JB022]
MKSLLFAALALPATLAADPALTLEFTIYLQAEGADVLGLNGSSFTFNLESSESQYQSVEVQGDLIPAIAYDSMSITIMGSDEWDGTFGLQTLGAFNNHYGLAGIGGELEEFIFAPLFPAGNTMGAMDSFLVVGELFVIGPMQVAAVFPEVAIGDSVNYADFEDLDYQVIFNQLQISTGEGSFETYNFSLTPAPAVPEPTTYAALLGLGAFAFAAWRRRR